jgi:hypothetical protein
MRPVSARHHVFTLHFIMTNRCKLSSSKRAFYLRQNKDFTAIKVNILIHHYGKRRQNIAVKKRLHGEVKKGILQSDAVPGKR